MINWDKPKKVHDPEDMPSFDGGPPGGYVPNMTEEDMRSWKGKIVGKKLKQPQVELRKTFGEHFGGAYAQVLIIVSLTGTGFKYGYYDRDQTKDVNIHISMNGAAHMTFEQLDEMNEAIEEAKQLLTTLL